MGQHLTLSVVIPALNEEEAILSSVKTVEKVVNQLGINYELILVDDGSTDQTGIIMNDLAKTNSSIKIIHNSQPKNIGYAFWQGIQKASGEYAMLVSGDNETSSRTLENVLQKIGQADLIISYPVNTEMRSFSRRIVSGAYTFILNYLFWLKLHYFNGSCLFRVRQLKQLPQWTNGFAFTSEILIQLVKKGVIYQEVPIYLQPRLGGQSKAISWKNLFLVTKAISKLFWRVYFMP